MFKITAIKSDYNISKVINDDGSESKGYGLSSGHYSTVELNDIEDLKDTITQYQAPDFILTFGNVKEEYEKNGIIKRLDSEEVENGSAIARARKFFEYSEGEGILFIDYDVKVGKPLTKLQLFDEINKVFPGFEDAPYLWKPSGSSCIYDESRNEWYTGLEGQHIFLLVDDVSKSEVLLAWLNHTVDGIDTSVSQPERIAYITSNPKYPYVKRDCEYEVYNNSAAPLQVESLNLDLNALEKSEDSGEKVLSKSSTDDEALTAFEHWDTTGKTRHTILLNYIHGELKDGRTKARTILNAKSLMKNVPENLRDSTWNEYYEEIERFTNEGYKKLLDAGSIEDEDESISEEDIANVVHRNDFSERLGDEELFPNGSLGKLARCFYETMWRPNKMMALEAAIGTIAYMAGGSFRGKYRDDTINVYLVGVGGTGVGKSILVNGPKHVVDEVFYDDNENFDKASKGIVSSIGSDTAVEDLFLKLGERPDVLFCWDEFGKAMQSFSNSTMDSKAKMMDIFLELWPVAHMRRTKRELSGDKDKDISVMNAPHMNIIGASTETTLTTGIDLSFVSDGHGARIIILPAEPYRENPVISVDNLTLGESLEGKIEKIFGLGEAGLDGFSDSALIRLKSPRKVNWDRPVDEFIHKIACKEFEDPEGLEAMVRNRDPMNIKKLAMIKSIADNPESPIVKIEDVEWGAKIVEYSARYKEYLFNHMVGENNHDRAEKSILAYIASAAGKWVPQTNLLHLSAMVKLSTSSRIPLLEYMLKDTQEIIRVRKPGRGRASYLYKLRTSTWQSSDAFVDGVLNVYDNSRDSVENIKKQETNIEKEGIKSKSNRKRKTLTPEEIEIERARIKLKMDKVRSTLIRRE